MPYIERWPEGGIKGVFSRPQLQPDGTFTTEPDEVSDEDPEVIAFLQGLNIRRGNALPLILQALHSRIEALEGRDLGAEMLAAQDEAGENLGDGESLVHRADEGAGAASDFGEASASADEMGDASGDGGDVSVSYPGIAIEQLSDEVSIRRAQVIDRITAIEEIRLDGLEDRLAARDEAIRNYNNWPAGVAMDPAVEAAAREWMRLDALASAIRRHASNLRRSARDASADILLSMWGSAINEGWPNDG